MRVKNEDLLEIDGTRAELDMTSTFNSKPVWLGHICNYSIQLVFTGTPAGSFKLQASNDIGDPTAAGEANKYASVTTWTDIEGSSEVISAPGNHMWNVENAGYNWVRLVWTLTSSTGTLTTARAYVKGF